MLINVIAGLTKLARARVDHRIDDRPVTIFDRTLILQHLKVRPVVFNADRKRRGCTIYIGVRNCGYFQLYGLSFHSFPSSQFCVSKRCLPRFFFCMCMFLYVFR